MWYLFHFEITTQSFDESQDIFKAVDPSGKGYYLSIKSYWTLFIYIIK